MGAGRDARARSSPTKQIPEPATFCDDYATRTDALHENQQRVAADLTNRDLKLEPPAGLAGAGADAVAGDRSPSR